MLVIRGGNMQKSIFIFCFLFSILSHAIVPKAGTEYEWECSRKGLTVSYKQQIMKTEGKNFYFLRELDNGALELYRKNSDLMATIIDERLATGLAREPLMRVEKVGPELLEISKYVNKIYKGVLQVDKEGKKTLYNTKIQIKNKLANTKYFGKLEVKAVSSVHVAVGKKINYHAFYSPKYKTIIYFWRSIPKPTECHLKKIGKFNVSDRMKWLKSNKNAFVKSSKGFLEQFYKEK